MRRRQVPVDERIPFFGELLFWLFLMLAAGSAILALAKPQAVTSLVRTAGVDLVILQDGSASMHVTDVKGDRWQRSMRFLRTLGEALRWENDRVAMALFAHMATPQIRLTKDPNTYFFFLDHLEDKSPFRLEDDGTWDTNIERGIYWGLRLIEKDEELRQHRRRSTRASCRSPNNSKAFVLISDGQSWSGEVAKSLALAQGRGIPLSVVGVGTTAGGIIPDPKREAESAGRAIDPESRRADAHRHRRRRPLLRARSRDRSRDRQPDHRPDAPPRRHHRHPGRHARSLYWNFLFAAGVFLALGVLFLRDRVALALQLGAAAAVFVFVQTIFGR